MFRPRIQSFVLRLPYALKHTSQWSRGNPLYSSAIRSLSFTAPRQATETSKPDLVALFAAFKETTMYQKISHRPEALQAIQNFAQVLQNQGVDTSKGPLSKLQMLKLLQNSEFREATKNLMEEFKKVGLDPNDKTMADEMANLMKLIPKV